MNEFSSDDKFWELWHHTFNAPDMASLRALEAQLKAVQKRAEAAQATKAVKWEQCPVCAGKGALSVVEGR